MKGRDNIPQRLLYSQPINDEASDRAFLFFRNDHAIWFVPQKEGASVPRTLVFSTFLLKYLCGFFFKVYKYVAIIFNTTVNVFDAHMLIEWNANQVDAPAAKARDLAQYLSLFQRNEEVLASHSRGHHLINVMFKHLGHRLVFKIALRRPLD
jgi:hypothetical protein